MQLGLLSCVRAHFMSAACVSAIGCSLKRLLRTCKQSGSKWQQLRSLCICTLLALQDHDEVVPGMDLPFCKSLKRVVNIYSQRTDCCFECSVSVAQQFEHQQSVYTRTAGT